MSSEKEGMPPGLASRWSRLKAEAREKGTRPAPVFKPSEAAAVAPDGEEAEIALADLPAIETINAMTDLTPWLAMKVPQAWRLAALRKVWSADPAISQFIGPSDYAWDWNAVDGVPGFGPLRAVDNIAKLVAQAIGAVDPSQESEIKQTSNNSDDLLLPENRESAGLQSSPEQFGQDEETEIQNDFTPVHPVRRGGSALPS